MPWSNGFVAILDVLGFKGIWQDCDPDKVIAHMKVVEDGCRSLFNSINVITASYGTPMEFLSAYFSDTIVLAVSFPENLEPNLIDNAFNFIGICSSVCAEAWALAEPARTLRGCVSYGKFMIDHPYIIGPAVDEAATYHESADGAFIWCTDSVLEAYVAKSPNSGKLGGSREWWSYKVPLKQAEKSTFALDYTYSRAIGFDDGACCLRLRERILGAFGDDNRLDTKRTHTERFIDECESRGIVTHCPPLDWGEFVFNLRP
jgi:hypothetical protein